MAQATPRPDHFGLLIVDKPLGWSSMTVVRYVRRAAGGARTGHAGTLDPLATGVVVCCLGKATRLVERLMGLPKTYEAQIDLSAFTATDDREAPMEPVPVATPPEKTTVESALGQFIGQVQQVPPSFSAVHVEGRRAYRMARQGQVVKLQPRTVRIDAIDLLEYAWPLARIRITCGRGTYIRSLARDLGRVLGTGGHLASLRRTAVGPFDLALSVDRARLERPITQQDLLNPEDYLERGG